MKIQTEAGQFVNESGAACGWSEDIGTYALAAAVNALTAENAVCMGVEAQILFPFQADPSRVYAVEKNLRKTCLERGIEIKGMKIQRSPIPGLPVVYILAAGQGQGKEQENVQAGDEVVLVKWIGMEGMLRIMDEKKSELSRRFAPVFIRQIQSYRKELFAGAELEIARSVGVSAVRQITEGGILAALWDLAKETGKGLNLDMKRMSILQETIEVCEQYRLNPYQLASAGSFLMIIEDGKALTDALCRNQIEASVIGRLTEENDKIIHNGEDIRYIDRPAPDEIFKILL